MKNLIALFTLLASFGGATAHAANVTKKDPTYTWQGYVLYNAKSGKIAYLVQKDNKEYRTIDEKEMEDTLICPEIGTVKCYYPPKNFMAISQINFEGIAGFGVLHAAKDCDLVYHATVVSTQFTLGFKGMLYKFEINPSMIDLKRSSCELEPEDETRIELH